MSRSRPSTWRGTFWLTASMLKRLTREGLVLRSLTFPTALVIGTLMMTIGVVAWLRWSPLVAVPPHLAHLEGVLVENDLRVTVVEDPIATVDAGKAWGGTDGSLIRIRGGGPKALVFESVVRQEAGARWRPDADVPRPPLGVAQAMGERIVILLGALFALYGVVFGAGMVARDRDSSTLEIELALPLPRWVHGATRLLTASLSLSAFLGLGILMVDAVIGLPDVAASIRHGIACAVGATSIGLLVIGRGGLKTGFTGPLTSGMTAATALFAFGLTAPGAARWLPLASFASSASGWEALLGAVVAAVLTVLLFTWRSARA